MYIYTQTNRYTYAPTLVSCCPSEPLRVGLLSSLLSPVEDRICCLYCCSRASEPVCVCAYERCAYMDMMYV